MFGLYNGLSAMYNEHMDSLKYYFDLDNDCVLAYDRDTDFFAQFDKSAAKWTMVGISFVQFMHDYNYKLISGEEAQALTNDNLPEHLYADYIKIINDNRNAT